MIESRQVQSALVPKGTAFVLRFLVCLAFVSGCCVSCSKPTIRQDMNPSQVTSVIGEPNVIYEQAGDLGRFRVRGVKVLDWPHPDKLVWYFLERDLQVVFENGRVIRWGNIEPELRKRIGRLLADTKALPDQCDK